jgi:hypothetical protein
VVQSGISHDLAAARRRQAAPLKAASTAGHLQQAKGLSLATFASAHALIICPLLLTKQNKKCLQNTQKMILF